MIHHTPTPPRVSRLASVTETKPVDSKEHGKENNGWKVVAITAA